MIEITSNLTVLITSVDNKRKISNKHNNFEGGKGQDFEPSLFWLQQSHFLYKVAGMEV